MKKLFTLLLSAVFCLTTVSCGSAGRLSDSLSPSDEIPPIEDPSVELPPENDEPTDNTYKPFKPTDVKENIFRPSEATNLNQDRFKEAFRQKFDYMSDGEYEDTFVEYYNYMPEEYSEKYNVDAFEIVTASDSSYFYLWHNGKIFSVAPFDMLRSASLSAYIHFSVSDFNKDGYPEIMVSYRYISSLDIDYVGILDTFSGHYIQQYGIHDYYAFFKKTENGIGVYQGTKNDPNAATTLYKEFTPNTKRYVFRKKSFSVETKDFTADVTIDEYTVHFPLVTTTNSRLQFKVTVAMKWLGESFSYTNGDTYKDGAVISFKNDLHEFVMEGWEAGSAITNFYVAKGSTITREYEFYRWNDCDAHGSFDATVSYRFSKRTATVENILSITDL